MGTLKNFIKIVDNNNKKYLININQITRIDQYPDSADCTIFYVGGQHGIHIKKTVDEIEQMLIEAQPFSEFEPEPIDIDEIRKIFGDKINQEDANIKETIESVATLDDLHESDSDK